MPGTDAEKQTTRPRPSWEWASPGYRGCLPWERRRKPAWWWEEQRWWNAFPAAVHHKARFNARRQRTEFLPVHPIWHRRAAQ